jgi:tol-pal system protein YbgF
MRGTAKTLFALIVFVGAMLATLPAESQSRNEFRALLQRVESLEKEVQALRRGGAPIQSQTGNTASGGSVEALVERQERMGAELDRQVREVTDTVERVRFEISTMSRRMDKLVRDVDQRLSDLEASVKTLRDTGATAPRDGDAASAGTAASDGVTPVVKGTDGSSGTAVTAKANALPQGTPVEQYSYAFGLLRQLKFGEAELALKDFLANHPDHELADNSRYWLGETFYVRKDYETAARIFLEGYQANKEGRKAPDNLLKLGLSLRKLGQQEDACATLRELLTGFKLASKKVLGRAQAELDEMRCS